VLTASIAIGAVSLSAKNIFCLAILSESCCLSATLLLLQAVQIRTADEKL